MQLAAHTVFSIRLPPLSLQVCLLDLDYNLPVQVRDYALGLDNEDEPSSGVGKEYALQRKVGLRVQGLGSEAERALRRSVSKECVLQRHVKSEPLNLINPLTQGKTLSPNLP